jgi:GNAT superfamily N-acetyltransferase
VTSIRVAESDEEIARCFPVMQQLRNHLVVDDFVPTVRRQQLGGYRLVYLDDGTQVCAVAGFRVIDNLVNGRVLYVDDLVTDVACRSRGHGKALLAALIQRARDESCRCLELDSGVQRFDAHRFYLTNRMSISSYHFTLKV